MGEAFGVVVACGAADGAEGAAYELVPLLHLKEDGALVGFQGEGVDDPASFVGGEVGGPLGQYVVRQAYHGLMFTFPWLYVIVALLGG